MIGIRVVNSTISDDPVIDVAGALLPVTFRRNAQAKRIVMRFDAAKDQVRMTLPRRTSKRKALKFAEKNIRWLIDERAKAEPITYLDHGTVISIEGDDLQIVFNPEHKRGVLIGDDTLIVGGPADMASKRLLRWLKAVAKTRITALVRNHADTLGVSWTRLSIGDMRSRWGSCSGHGTLRFNWRLIMAPPDIINYVAAHEVAHLVEMNHSPEFWQQVERCTPDWKVSRRWLHKHGGKLFAVQALETSSNPAPSLGTDQRPII